MTFKESFRLWRRRLKANMPYVRRREYKILQRRHEESLKGLSWVPLANQASLQVLKPISKLLVGEVCFFVSYAPKSELKPHVQSHLRHFLQAGVQVVLILNTDLTANQFVIDAELLDKLSGVLVRKNVGFDFAAWAHAYALCENRDAWTRLYLVNDSIVGPLSTPAFETMVARVRASQADFIGLTENMAPTLHIQSFFLVFAQNTLRHPVVNRIFRYMLSFQSKEQVIDLYEIQLTQYLAQQGLRCEALFPNLAQDACDSNDTYFRWHQLIQNGFPYIKASVLKELGPHSSAIKAVVPAEFLQRGV
jgi:lipopolysaccharide biosynthesis protein